MQAYGSAERRRHKKYYLLLFLRVLRVSRTNVFMFLTVRKVSLLPCQTPKEALNIKPYKHLFMSNETRPVL